MNGNAPPHDLVVFSDLHLGEGCQDLLGHCSPMEDFFYDEAFSRLLDHLQQRYRDDPSRLVLVLNGDILDFLTVTRIPADESCTSGKISAVERKFGMNPSPENSVFKLDTIVAGHQRFFTALARFLSVGFRLEMVRGNHDLELFFPEVQQRLVQHLDRLSGSPPGEIVSRVRFHQWFYLEPGRLYIEHGNQYEASNSIRYPLHPLLPSRKRTPGEDMLDYPLGSLFVRYFYNRVHRINPYNTKVISFEQYLEFIRRNNLLDLLRVARDHYPFFNAALRPQTPTGRSRSSSEEDAQQEAAFEALQEADQPGELYRELNKLKVHPLSASKLALVRQMLRPLLRKVLWNGSVGVTALYLWLLIFNIIQAPLLAENVFAKATLLFFFSLFSMVGLLWLGNYLGQKMRRQTDVTVETCALSADRIARLTGVKLVLMGHTHVADIRPVADGQATYANSGSWVTVNSPWSRLMPDARRLTFQYVQGDQVRICRWNDNAGRIEGVLMFESQSDSGPERCPT